MTVISETMLTTTEELLGLPEDGVERDLLRGRLRQLGMTRRNRKHSGIEAEVAWVLRNWLQTQPEPRGQVLCGEPDFRLRRDPDTTVGIDVAHISAETAAANPEDAPLVEGPPVLAVEILSPSDRQEDVVDKTREYLACGVKLVWIIEPVFRTVTVFRPDAAPAMFTGSQPLPETPHLPGLRVRVAELCGE